MDNNKSGMKKPLIIMIHRVEFKSSKIDESYYQRNLVVSIKDLIRFLKDFIKNGYSFGSLSKTLQSNRHLHLTFDDGYKEDLLIAKKLKEIFHLKKKHCSFAINIGNSLRSNFSGMDLIYNVIKSNPLNKIVDFFSIGKNFDVENIKDIYIKMNIQEIENLKQNFNYDKDFLKNQFLSKEEVIGLSKLFNVISHGIFHRDLRFHCLESEKEIKDSKILLEALCNNRIDMMFRHISKNVYNIKHRKRIIFLRNNKFFYATGNKLTRRKK